MPSLSVHDLGSYLREQRETARLSVRQLSELAGVSNPYLSQIERGLKKPSAEILGQLAKGLRISAESLYVRAGILEQREDHLPVESAILADLGLSERQKRVLLDIYESFRTENDRGATVSVATAVNEQAVKGRPAPVQRAARKAAATSAAEADKAEVRTAKNTARASKRAAKTTQKKAAADGKSAVRATAKES